jgi:hypothetical protein
VVEHPGASDADARFAELQRRLRSIENAGAADSEEQTVVIMPSLDVGRNVLIRHQPMLPTLEERALYQLLMLRHPNLRAVLLTSSPVPEAVLDYQLSLIPETGDVPARDRLVRFSPDDDSPRPLAEKLLDRPDLIEEIRAAVGDPGRAFIAPYDVGPPERDLALALGIPIYGPGVHAYEHGTKRGSRAAFAAAGVSHPPGVNGVATREEVAAAIQTLRRDDPALTAVVIKLNDSVYGEGNRVVRTDDLPLGGTAEEQAEILRRLDEFGDDYWAELASDPGIVEAFVVGSEMRSPSVQMRIMADGSPGLVSTHDQLLGGPRGQQFVGCTFPANESYAGTIAAETAKLRAALAARGVVGRFGVDFVVVRDPDSGAWMPYAVEINLREGGTSHPFGALYLLTDGRYDAEAGRFETEHGPRYYVASDDLEGSVPWKGLTIEALLDAARAEPGLLYDHASQTGVVFHMLRSLEPFGVIGATAIAGSRDAAQELYARVPALLDRLAGDQAAAARPGSASTA